jgi:polysaccharide biosynthesis protein PelE
MKGEDEPSIFADDRFNIYYSMLALCLLLVETLPLFWGRGLKFFLVLHACITLLLIFFVLYAIGRHWDRRLPFLLGITLVLFGPFGSAGILIFLLFYVIFKRHSTPFEKWYAALFPDLQLSPAGKIYERILAGWDDYKTQREVVSFKDLMQVGSVEQKQTVLEMIAQNFNALLAPILKEALDDPSNQIRVQAASIIAKIERDFELKKKELIQALEKEPHTPSHLLALAEHLDTYAFAGIIDFFRERESRELAIEYYRKYIDQCPDDHQAWMALGRLLNRVNAFDQVMEWFEQRLKQSTHIPASSYAWYWEALYMLHSFNKLSESAQTIYRKLVQSNPQKDLLECVQLWASKRK